MEGYEAAHANAGQTLRAVKKPAALQAPEGLLAFGKEFCGHVLR
jgi:hypothetical protein